MGEKDELLYGMYPGNYVMALGDFCNIKYHITLSYILWMFCMLCFVYAILLTSDFSTTSSLFDNTHLNSLSLTLSPSLSWTGDVDGEPVRDWNELLDAGYRLERQYVREMVHIIDAKRIFDPKLPLEHDGATFSKNLEMTSKMLEVDFGESQPSNPDKFVQEFE